MQSMKQGTGNLVRCQTALVALKMQLQELPDTAGAVRAGEDSLVAFVNAALFRPNITQHARIQQSCNKAAAALLQLWQLEWLA